MVLLRYLSEEVYIGRLAGIFVWLCEKLFLYVGSYENVYI